MFIHGEDHPETALLIPQVSHAWMAWQLAAHWGNRDFPRPSPRPETLAAVLLHDSGWTDFDAAPRVDDGGRPLTFDRMPPEQHIPIWRSSVVRAAAHSRYSGLLVSAHFSGMARRKEADRAANGDAAGSHLAAEFCAESARLEERWCAELGGDARYQGALDGAGRRVNARLLSACDAVSVRLCASMEGDFGIEAPDGDGEVVSVDVRADGGGRFRIRPWPLVGDRVRLHCEGRRPGRLRFSSEADLRSALDAAETVRLSFTLLRSSAR